MANKFTKLTIGYVVHTVGSRVFRKLTTESVGLPIWNGTDLTGTTWYVPSGWLATAGYGKFNVNCNTTDSSGEEFYIGYYDAMGMGVAEPTANRVGIFTSGFPIYTPPNTKDFTITFTGGTDATNTALISWLKQYGQLTSHQMQQEQEDELQGTWVFNDTLTLDTTVNYSVNFTSNGVSYTALTVWHGDTVMPRPKGLYFANSDVEFEVYYSGWHEQIYKTITITSKLSEVENGDALLIWLKANATKQSATTPTLITFTVGTTTYQAEEGMTWYEYCNSDYNTTGFYCWREDAAVETGRYTSTYITFNESSVIGTDTIISNATYSTQHTGGSND